jgi:hypothetical protein
MAAAVFDQTGATGDKCPSHSAPGRRESAHGTKKLLA